MDTIKLNQSKTKIIAHRGLSGLEKENTLFAFVAAGNRSYFGIETDVHKTADNHYVIIHDDNTKRVSNIDLTIEETNFKNLREINLLDIDNSTDRIDIKIPALNEYILTCKKYDKIAVLELKNHFEKNEVLDIIKIIKNQDFIDKVIFISFDFENLVFVREELPKQKVQFLVEKYNKKVLQQLVNSSFDIDIDYHALNKKVIDELHENGIEINCWTVNDKATAEKLIEYGVDYITSNILE